MPLYPAKSTSFSDAVLGISCIWAFVTLGGLPWDWSDTANVYTSLAKIYFGTSLAACLVGIFRFGEFIVKHIHLCLIYFGNIYLDSSSVGFHLKEIDSQLEQIDGNIENLIILLYQWQEASNSSTSWLLYTKHCLGSP